MEWGSVAAWASTFVATIGLAGILYQTRKARQLNSANLLLALESKFGEPGMILARKEFAERIKNHLSSTDNALTGYHAVLAFYDTLAAQVNRGLLDEMLIWHRFGWRVLRCWLGIAANPHHAENRLPCPGSLIDRLRILENEPTAYTMLEWLGNRFVEMDVKYNRQGTPLSKEQQFQMVMQYHKQESTLVAGNH
ncbi:MAG: hypothetical protein U0796_15335 [Gemmatales bacterium]